LKKQHHSIKQPDCTTTIKTTPISSRII